MRLVAIVLGTPVSQTRFNEARQMLDYGFAAYRRVVIANKGDLLGQNAEVRGGSAESVPLALGSGLSMLLKTGSRAACRCPYSCRRASMPRLRRGMSSAWWMCCWTGR